ncbi:MULTISPECIES: HIT family protein [Streptomyces]|uniref:HIT family protein n=1 Tax=Streptomyces TaxID=1883 RepID=UPI0004BDC001|nr:MULTISPECIES: HIT family protein [Streptomyces]
MRNDDRPPDGNCAFCGIVADPSRARVVYEDDHTVAFFPLAPATRGHTLVVPRTHAADLWEMADAEVQHLMRTVLAVGRALRVVLEPAGMNVIHSAGQVASQTVFHAHVHLVPRLPGDAMGEIWPPREPPRNETDLDELAQRIRSRVR